MRTGFIPGGDAFNPSKPPTKEVTSDYTLENSDYIVLVDTDLGDVTVTLPLSPENRQTHTVQWIGSTNTLTIATVLINTIAQSIEYRTRGDALTFQWDSVRGTWWVIGR